MSHLSAIGFTFKNPEEFLRFVEGVANEGEMFSGPHGYYSRWSPGVGVELWAHVNPKRMLVGCGLHFSGCGEMRVSVTQTFPGARGGLDGSIYGWANPADENNPYSGEFAFVAAVPNFDAVEEPLLLNPLVTVQIAAFAQEIRCFGNDNVYYSLNPDSTTPISAFIPSWRQGMEASDPSPEAFCSGSILQTELRANPVTEREFYWMLVQTPGGTIDMVADPEIVRTKPTIGGIVQGTFWLSARVITPLPEAAPPPLVFPSTFRRARRT